MEKQIYKLTSVFIRISPLMLFILITFPVVIRFTTPYSESFDTLNMIAGSIGGMCLFAWLFAIGHKGNEKLISQEIHLDAFRYFNWLAIVCVLTFLLILFVSQRVHTTVNGIQINYVTPVFLPIIFCLSFLCIIFIAAKTLVSAELNKEAKVGEYFTTVLLMMISLIGLWFIQPRVQKI